jgi:predicted ATPase with chaperone activity
MINVLEVLCQPLEDGSVTISRAAASLTFPCQFILVGAMNPCPCGYYRPAQTRMPVHALANPQLPQQNPPQADLPVA